MDTTTLVAALRGRGAGTLEALTEEFGEGGCISSTGVTKLDRVVLGSAAQRSRLFAR